MALRSIAVLLLFVGIVQAEEQVAQLGNLWERMVRQEAAETAARKAAPRSAEEFEPAFEVVSRIGGAEMAGAAGKMDASEGVRLAIAIDPPTAADSAATSIVRLTPEIRARAEALGRDPLRIYDWVYNNVELELYAGAMQVSSSVLMSRRAGDYDMATLLIALLRAAGVPARYVRGTVRMDRSALMNLVGAKDFEAALYMAQQAFPVEVNGSMVDVTHVWVEAFLPGATGWTTLDPSFKVRKFQPGIVIPKLAFDSQAYLSTVRTDLPSDAYLTQLRDYVAQNLPGKSLADLAYVDQIVPGPFPCVFIDVRFRLSELRAQDQHRIIIDVTSEDGVTVYLTRELLLPEVVLQSIAVSLGPETLAAPFPAGVITPQLRLDGQIVAAGAIPMPAAATTLVKVRHFSPGGQERVNISHPMRGNQTVAIGVDALQNGAEYLNFRIDRLLASNPATADAAQTAREILHIAVMRYMMRVDEAKQQLAVPLQYRFINWRPSFAFTKSTLPLQNLQDRPFLVTPQRLNLDSPGGNSLVVDLNSGSRTTPELTAFRRLYGLTFSALEHELWEEIALVRSASAVRIFQYASQTGIPMVTFGPSTAAARIAQLPFSAEIKADMLDNLNQGYGNFTLPGQAVVYLQRRFVAYFAEGDSGQTRHILIRDDGGATAENPGPVGKPPGPAGNPLPQGGQTTGDPVNISNGNMFHQTQDLLLPAPGLPLQLVRTYNSQVAEAGPFGFGWTHSYNLSIQQQGNTLLYRNATGGVEVLTAQGSDWAGFRGMRVSRDGLGWRLRFRQGLELHFSASGKLTSISDPNGNTQTLDYDAQGNLVTITDAANRKITFSYGGQNRIAAVTDFAGRQSQFRYNSAGDLEETQDPSGALTRYTYLANHNMTSVTGPEGNVTSWVYYSDDKVFKIIGPGGGEMQLFYLPFRNETLVVDERGQSRTYQYDSAGRITMMMDPLGNVSTRKYTAEGWLAEETDAVGNKTAFSWDALGNLIKIVDPLGNVTEATYDPVYSRVTQIRDAKGNTERFEYDTKGNLIRSVDAANAESLFIHDAHGFVTGATRPDGNTWRFVYDEAGHLTQLRDPDQQVVRLEYDNAGLASAVVNPLDARILIEHDSRGLVTRGVNAVGNVVAFAYDRAGRNVRTTVGESQTQQFAYDGSSNLTRVTAGDGRTVEYLNRPEDCECESLARRLSQVKSSSGARSTYTYDVRGAVSEIRNPVGESVRYRRDANSNLSEIAYDDGTTIQFTYDANNRLTGRNYSNGAKDTFTYDGVGNLLTAANSTVTYTFGYDARNVMTSVHDSRFPQPIRYEYDSTGRRQRMIDPQGVETRWSYHPDGALASIQSPDGRSIRFTYDGAGRRQNVTFPNQTEANYSYDAAGRLLSLAYAHTASKAVLNRFDYTYDTAGNRTSMTDGAGTHFYGYDATYRLANVKHPDQPAEQYAYDVAGNRVSSHQESSFTYDAADRLLRTSAAEFRYDLRGNLVMRTVGLTTTYFRYGSLNQLEEIETGVADKRTRGAAAVTTYKYDPFGRRIEKNVGGALTRYLYDFAQVVQEYDGTALLARYTYGTGLDEPLLMERDRNANGSLEPEEGVFYQADALGSVRALTDRTGNILERYRYDTFGNLVDGAGTLGNSYFFTGREWDAEGGIYSYRARHYDPALGRFLQEDPIWNPVVPDSLNRYVYVRNDPANSVDPRGTSPEPPDIVGTIFYGTKSVQKLEAFENAAGEIMYQRPGWYFDEQEGIYKGPVGFTTQEVYEPNVSASGGQKHLVHPDDALMTTYDTELDSVKQIQLVPIMGEYRPTYFELPSDQKTLLNIVKYGGR